MKTDYLTLDEALKVCKEKVLDNNIPYTILWSKLEEREDKYFIRSKRQALLFCHGFSGCSCFRYYRFYITMKPKPQFIGA